MTGKQLELFSMSETRFILGLADKQRPEEKPAEKRRRIERERTYTAMCTPLATSQ
jgi:hypothetical protein